MNKKSFYLVAIAFSLAFAVSSCKEEGEKDNSVAVTGVTLDESLSMVVGDEETLTATVTPTGATNKAVEWSWVSEPAGNTVLIDLTPGADGKATVKAKEAGKAIVTVTAKDGSGKKASCTITITPKTTPPVLVSSVTLDAEDEEDLFVGDDITLKATVLPVEADNKEVEWSWVSVPAGDDELIELTENEDGSVTVTANAEGKAIVTATAKDGSGKKASCTVTIAMPHIPEWVDITDQKLGNPHKPFDVINETPNAASTNLPIAIWKTNDEGKKYDNVQNNADRSALFAKGWSYNQEIINGKMWQTVQLEAGLYKFYAYNSGIHNAATPPTTFIVAAIGTELPDIADLDGVKGKENFPKTKVSDTYFYSEFEFELTQQSTVSLGFVCSLLNAYGNAIVFIHGVELWKFE